MIVFLPEPPVLTPGVNLRFLKLKPMSKCIKTASFQMASGCKKKSGCIEVDKKMAPLLSRFIPSVNIVNMSL